MGNGTPLGLEPKLWAAADALRNNMDAAEYKHVVLGLIFLKYISDVFEAKHAELETQKAQEADPEDPDEYRAASIFWVPKGPRWSHLSQIRVHEEWEYDNWDGGTYGQALYINVPEALYLNSVGQRKELQSEIAADINKIHEDLLASLRQKKRLDLQKGHYFLKMGEQKSKVVQTLSLGGKMKRTILAVITLLTVFGLGMLTGVPRGHSVGEAPALAAPVPAALAAPMPHRCPAIHEAVRALEVAMHDMEEARHDFCGRKGEAMESTRRAIHQLREAENCARCRE